MFTTHQAADLLNVSYNHLMSLIETGDIRGLASGEQMIVSPEDLLAFKWKRDRTQAGMCDQSASADIA